MKQLIVLIASVMLGAVLVGLIAGPQPTSSYSIAGELWQKEIAARSIITEPAK